jgi:hypothetical protein
MLSKWTRALLTPQIMTQPLGQPPGHVDRLQYEPRAARKARKTRGGFVQFHLNGFEPGDPEISDPAQRHAAPGSSGTVPQEVDVLIVGCGPAGLTLAA